MDHTLHPWLHDTVSALVYSLAEAHAGSDPALSSPYNDLTRFILKQQGQMPDYLRLPMRGMTLGFDALGWLRRARRFHTAAPEQRKKQIRDWQRSSLGFKRDLMRYYESLTAFALFSRLDSGGQPATTPCGSLNGQREVPQASRCQIAVIGSGPGGAVTACLLAEAGREVVLLEEGPFQAPGSVVPFSKQEMLALYRNGGQTLAMGRDKVAYVEGRCVGGGSEINSGLYHRTPPEALESWRKDFGVDGLLPEELRPHFEACEHELSVATMPGPAPAASLRLRQGADRLGWKCLEVPRWFKYEGAGATEGTRQTMTRTYIQRFLKAGGSLWAGVRVLRLRQANGRWTLEAERGSYGRLSLTAETVFVAAGAIQTPALLRRSGITRNVGNSLQLHPTVKITARFSDAVNSEDMGVPVHQVKEFAPRLTFGCSISSRPYLALGLVGQNAGGAAVSAHWRHMANYYAMVAGSGKGTVRPLPLFRDPLVRYGVTDADRRDLAQGLKKLAELLFAAGAVELYPSVTGVPALRTTGDLRHLPDALLPGGSSLMTIHLFSSCPMGEDQSRCAADSYGRVQGFSNLYVADASLLCTAPGVNPQGTIMAIARRNALKFLG